MGNGGIEMKHEREFLEFMIALKNEGLKFPRIDYDNEGFGADLSEYSDRIDGLAAYLAFRIRYTSPKIISVLEVLTEGIQVQLKEPLVWYGPKDIEGRSPKEWKAL